MAVTAAELDLENDKPKVTSERARANSIFAEQRIQAIMSNSLENQAEADIGKVRKRPKPLQRSQSVWKDVSIPGEMQFFMI